MSENQATSSGQPGSTHEPVVIPTGFYTVTPAMRRYLLSETTALASGLQQEARHWTIDNWQHLYDPPDYLTVQHFIRFMAKDLPNEDAARNILEANRNLLTAQLRTAKQTTEASDNIIRQIILYPPAPIINTTTEDRCLAQLTTIAAKTSELLKKVDDYSSLLNKARNDADARFSLQQKSVMASLTTISTNSNAAVASTSRVAPTDVGQIMTGVTTRIPPMGSQRPVTAASGSGIGSQSSAKGSQDSSKSPMEW